MQPQTFIAESAGDAIAQIRGQLGPDAVVLSVKQLPAAGLGRLWQKPKIEVVACVPDQPQAPAEADPLGEIKRQLAELRQQLEHRPGKPDEPVEQDPSFSRSAAEPTSASAGPMIRPVAVRGKSRTNGESDPYAYAPTAPPRVVQILEKIGILPLYIQQVLELMRQGQGDTAPQTLPQEVEAVCSTLKRMWRTRGSSGTNVHVFVGPPGSGKTTCLCKWLAKSVLLDNRRARVWRLDGAGPNAAESLSVYAEILGVPLDRFPCDASQLDPSELLFIDLPGVNWKDPSALGALAQQVGELPAGHVHLVLNAAYEVPLLLAQARAFSDCSVFDVVVSHLDEERRWGKLWNLVLGTNCAVGWGSAGQNIPGEFYPASPQMLFEQQFSRK